MAEKIAHWGVEEIERMDKEAANRVTGEFISASNVCPVGRTVIEIQNKKPETVKGDFGTSAIFIVKKEEEVLNMSVKKTSPLYRDIVEKLVVVPEQEYLTVAVIRTGDGKKTRYSLE